MLCTACGKQNADSATHCCSCCALIQNTPANCVASSPDVESRDVSLEFPSIADTGNPPSPVGNKGGAWLARREALKRKLTQLPVKPLTAGVPLTMKTVLDVLADKVRLGNSGNAYLPGSYEVARVAEDKYVAWLRERRGRTYRSHHVDIDLGSDYQERQKYESELARKKKEQS
jgi:hypothetical protein